MEEMLRYFGSWLNSMSQENGRNRISSETMNLLDRTLRVNCSMSMSGRGESVIVTKLTVLGPGLQSFETRR